MIRKIVIGCIVIALALIDISNVNAHVFATDGSIKMGLHIEPADQPGVNEISYLHFSFEDTEKKLDLRQCDCTVRIQQGSTVLFSEKIRNNNSFTVKANKISFEYIFPSKGIYTVTIEGTSLLERAFQSFTLQEDIRVERDQTMSTSTHNISNSHVLHTEHMSHVVIFGLGILAACVVVFKDNKKA